MRRRGLLGVAAMTLVGRPGFAQGKVARVAILTGLTEQDAEIKARLAAFRSAMAVLGWHEGQNLVIDVRYAADSIERARPLVAEVLALRPDVVVVQAEAMPPMLDAKAAIPIVFVFGPDPVAEKWVESLARPGGNATGLTSAERSIGAKWVEFLKEIAPSVQHIGVLGNISLFRYRSEIEDATRRFGIEVAFTRVQAPGDIEPAIEATARKPNGALVLPPEALTTTHRSLFVELALRHRLPMCSGSEPMARAGALVVYAIDSVDVYRRSAAYVDRILRGARPAELPVQQPTAFRMLINLKTARALGLSVPASILTRADEVIE